MNKEAFGSYDAFEEAIASASMSHYPWIYLGELSRFTRCDFCGNPDGIFRVRNEETREEAIACSKCWDRMRWLFYGGRDA